MLPIGSNLKDREIGELEAFLASQGTQADAFDAVGLDGFFTAVILSPRLVPPSIWIPWVWDSRNGKNEPEFGGFDAAQRIFHLLMSYYNMIGAHLAKNPDVYEPRRPMVGRNEALSWYRGFTVGQRFDRAAWDSLANTKPEWMRPISSLGPTNEDERGQDSPGVWTPEVGRAVAQIHAHFFSQRPIHSPGPANKNLAFSHPRATPGPASKVGRNELCPCGSGKKHKRCCGR